MEWHLKRGKRITASKAYELFTYTRNKKPDWPKKIGNCINPSKYQSAAMRYGTLMETEAISWYEQHRGIRVSRQGFTIHPKASFIGCSPDGVMFEQNRIVEIKCPLMGKAGALAYSKIPFLYKHDNQFKLKEKHMYYAQIMINLIILNVKVCDLVIYSSFSKSGLIIPVQFDEPFAKEIFKVLTSVYFQRYLPVLADF